MNNRMSDWKAALALLAIIAALAHLPPRRARAQADECLRVALMTDRRQPHFQQIRLEYPVPGQQPNTRAVPVTVPAGKRFLIESVSIEAALTPRASPVGARFDAAVLSVSNRLTGSSLRFPVLSPAFVEGGVPTRLLGQAGVTAFVDPTEGVSGDRLVLSLHPRDYVPRGTVLLTLTGYLVNRG